MFTGHGHKLLLTLCLITGLPPLVSCHHLSPPPLTIAATQPADRAEGVEPDTHISAILTGTVDDSPPLSLTLSDGKTKILGAVSVDVDARTISLAPARALALSTAHSATLTLPRQSQGGASPRRLKWSFTTRDVAAWQFVDGGGLNWSVDWDTYFPQLTALGNKLYAAWREMPYLHGPMQLRVAVYNGDDAAPAWRFVDGDTSTGGINWDRNRHGFAIQITAFEGRLYAIWEENSVTVSQIRVAVYNGDDDHPAWTFVDGNGPTGLNHDPKFVASYPNLTTFAGKLYAVWNERYGRARQIRAAVYNGNDRAPGWRFVDGDTADGINYNPARSGFHPQLTAFGDKLVAAWVERNRSADQIRIATYNSVDRAPAWTFIDGGGDSGINRDAARSAAYPELAVYAARLYAIWTEKDAHDTNQVRVAVYNDDDSAPAWTPVDSGGVSGLNRNPERMAYEPQLTAFGARLYATWYEGDHKGRGQIRVAVYNGDDGAPEWTFADGGGRHGINKNPRRSALDPQLTVFDSRLYITWKELIGSRGQRVHVAVGR